MTGEQTDPRRDLASNDARPVIALPPSGLSARSIIALFAGLAVVLFLVLDARRRAMIAPQDAIPLVAPIGAFQSAPPLVLPIAPSPPALVQSAPRLPSVQKAPKPTPQPAPVQPPVQAYRPPPPPPPYYPPPAPAYTANPGSSGRLNEPVLVVDLTPGEGPSSSAGGSGTTVGTASMGDDVAHATIIRGRSTLVPQGTLISAVLETPLNSSRPGLARAVISRDVRGFDGSRVLAPRGSRLIGEFRSDASAGQHRVLVTWTRLIRPDGVAIRIGSPSTDALGGAGIAGSVNTHFFQRFVNAILQSALTVGVNLASRPRDGTVIVGLPGQLGSVGQSLLPDVNPQATIKVRHGIEIGVFVARDLDFAGASPRQ